MGDDFLFPEPKVLKSSAEAVAYADQFSSDDDEAMEFIGELAAHLERLRAKANAVVLVRDKCIFPLPLNMAINTLREELEK